MREFMLEEPLDFVAAKALIRSILESGDFRVTDHAFKEMDKDGMTEIDVVNVLRGGVVEGCDFERASWRYRVRTPRFIVVVSFRSESALVVVTAWRN
jgi:hypothetical protein